MEGGADIERVECETQRVSAGSALPRTNHAQPPAKNNSSGGEHREHRYVGEYSFAAALASQHTEQMPTDNPFDL